jgi:hypothetical protein
MNRRKFLKLIASGAVVAAAASFGAYEILHRISPNTTTTNVTTTITGTPNPSKYSTNISKAVNYSTVNYNSTVDLYSNPGGSELTPVSSVWLDGSPESPLSQDVTFEPMEDWKQAWCAICFPQYVANGDSSQGYKVLQALDKLKTEVNWVHNMKDSPVLGVPIGFDFPNTNVSLSPAGQLSGYPVINGLEVAIFSAMRVIPGNPPKWIPWNDVPYTKAVGYNPGAIDFTLYSALNFALRGRSDLALQNLNAVAQNVTKNSDGSVSIGPSPSRGMFLGTFLFTCQVLNSFSPPLPQGIQLADIESTMWGIQNSDGGVARNYNALNSTPGNDNANSDNETTSAAVLPYCTKLIQYVQGIINSKQYNMDSPAPGFENVTSSGGQPTGNFVVNPFGSTTTTTST